MLLKVKKEHIIEGLQKASSIIPTKSGAAYLRSIWIKANEHDLTILSTDTHIEFIGTYPAEISESGLVGVNGRNFVDLLRKMPSEEISLQLDKESSSLVIEQGRRNYKLPANDLTWFQELSPFAESGFITWSGDLFQEIIDQVFYCISDDESSDALACIYLKAVSAEKIDVCGLNGHQFAVISFNNPDLAGILPEEGILIQRKFLAEFRKWLGSEEINVYFTTKRAFVRTGDGREIMSVPRASFKYPEYNAFLDRLNIPTASTLILKRKPTLEALDRISVFNTEQNICTYFELSNQEVILSAQGQDVGFANETLEANYDGQIKNIAFPTKKLMEILNHFTSEDLTLTLTTNEGPCGVKGSNDPDYVVIIMPMKIAEEENLYEEK